MCILDDVNWHDVKNHYFYREGIHEQLLKLHNNRKIKEFAELVLGVSDAAGNYSAYEHNLGPMVLCVSENHNAHQRVFDLATKFMLLTTARDVPTLIMDAGLRYCQIGVGSEASCMVNPSVCWVANTRTIWTHLVVTNGGNLGNADEVLGLYLNADINAAAIHRELGNSMAQIAEEGAERARCASIQPGKLTYLWADAIASRLYADHHEENCGGVIWLYRASMNANSISTAKTFDSMAVPNGRWHDF